MRICLNKGILFELLCLNSLPPKPFEAVGLNISTFSKASIISTAEEWKITSEGSETTGFESKFESLLSERDSGELKTLTSSPNTGINPNIRIKIIKNIFFFNLLFPYLI